MNQNIAAILKTWGFLWNHPISSQHRLAALGRWLRWQVGARLLDGQAIVPFVNEARLLVRRGMTGATGNIYTGLQEFEEMAFALHLLRSDDLFVDVGANVGVYTVLAAAVVGARCVAIEPIPSTYRDLVANIRLNEVDERVRCLQVGISSAIGSGEFTSELDTVNHVVTAGEPKAQSIVVPLTTLDQVLETDNPTLLKVDVEGFETRVFQGASAVLGKSNLLALIVELNGSGDRYGFDEAVLVRQFSDYGFRPLRYSPFQRTLMSADGGTGSRRDNTLFIRRPEEVLHRLKEAPAFFVKGVSV